MKNLSAVVGFGLAALLLASCPSPSNPSPTSNYISYSLNGASTTTYYTSGMISGSSTLDVTTPGVPLASIPATSTYLYLYASKTNADFEVSGVDYICINIALPTPSSHSISAGSYLTTATPSAEGANIKLQIGSVQYTAGGAYNLIDLILNQSIDNSTSIGQTITGTFSGTITPSTGGFATISGSYNLIYQTSTGTVS